MLGVPVAFDARVSLRTVTVLTIACTDMRTAPIANKLFDCGMIP
jgi:hypothetical protein